MTLIGLMGQKRSGKDTVATILIGEGFTRFAFADPLREAALRANPIIGHFPLPGRLAPIHPVRLRDFVDAVGWEKAKEHPEVRRTLQELGLAIRQIDPDFWLTATMRKVAWESDVVITDVRFHNEAEEIMDWGGVLIRIDRPGLPDADRHVSENGWRDIDPDFVLDNAGTIEELREAVLLTLDGLRRHP